MTEEAILRLGLFLGILVLMMLLEALFPKRPRQQARHKRWPTNLLLVAISAVCLKLLGPLSAVIVAEYALDQGWGLLAYSPIPLPIYMEILLGIMLLDLAVYLQHIAMHRIPFLWRMHKVHHADRDIDVTTGVRFHPLEIILSMAYKCGIIVLLGPIALAVIIFEILLNASAMFNHANLHINKKVDSVLRKIIVTPDFHRVHHSVIEKETNSNYGFFLSIWDRLGKTYRPQPKDNHHGMTIGLNGHQSNDPALLTWCLMTPLKNQIKEIE